MSLGEKVEYNEDNIDNLSADDIGRLLEGTVELMGPGNGVEEVDSLFESEENPAAYVGFEPSGNPHIGHLITFQKLNDLAEIGFEPRILLADRHAYLNGKPSGVPEEDALEQIEGHMDTYRKAFEALSTGPESAFPALEGVEFVQAWDMHGEEDYTMTDDSVSRQMEATKAEAATGEVALDDGNGIKLGQAEYPAMQVADIYHMGIDVAVGGIDQRKIHALARDYVPVNYDDEDKPLAVHTPLIGNNIGDGDKMSSSSGTALNLDAEEDEIRSAVNKMDLYTSVSDLARQQEGAAEGIADANKEGVYSEDILYMASPALQLADQFALRNGGELSWVQDGRFRDDGEDKEFVYDNTRDLIYDIQDGTAHPADVKGALSDHLIEMLEPVRNMY